MVVFLFPQEATPSINLKINYWPCAMCTKVAMQTLFLSRVWPKRDGKEAGYPRQPCRGACIWAPPALISQPFLAVPLMKDRSLPLAYSVYIQSSFDLLCGVLYGSLTTVFTVTWTVLTINPERSTTVAMYNTEQTTPSPSDGMYRYDPTTAVLHIANFTNLEDKHINITCQVCRAGSESMCEDHTTRLTILSGDSSSCFRSGHACMHAEC